MRYEQIDLFDALCLEDMPDIRVGDICKLVPREENLEYYNDYYRDLVNKEVKVIAVTHEHANALRPAAWIVRKDVETCCYFDDLVKVV